MTAFKASSALLNTPLMRRQTTERDLQFETGELMGRGPSVLISCANRFKRKYQRSPDRAASWLRRRRLGSKSIALPQECCELFTEGQRAVLNIIGNCVKQFGCCDWPLDKIAALAGVCRRTVQNTIKAAEECVLLKVQARPRLGRKNLNNVIRIVSSTWLGWLKRVKSSFHLSIGCKTMHPTSEKISNIPNQFSIPSTLMGADSTQEGLWKGKRPDD